MSGNLYFLFLFFKNMDSIDRILNFINSTEEEPETETTTEQQEEQQETTTEEQETTTEEQQEEQQETETRTKPRKTKQATPSIEPPTTEPREYDEKTYKSILRKANNTIKKNQYPAVISINGKNQVFTSGDDLKLFVNNLKTEHKEYNKNKFNDKINSYKHFNEEYTQDINDIEEDGIIYKKGNIKAITKDNKRYKVPSTSTKDRQQIYNKLKGNKKVLTDLVKSKDNNEFNDISLSNIDNDGKELIEKHKDNTINNDKTWTRDEFIKMMEQLMKKQEQQKQTTQQPTIKDERFKNTYLRPAKPMTNTPGGLNPFLLSPRL